MTMATTRKQFLFAALAALLGATSVHAADDAYPSRPITILMGFAAGSATDAAIRLIAPKMSEALKVPVIVENRPGANQIVAINALKASKPDGYTLYVGTGSTLAQNVAVNTDLTYQPLRDFSFVGTIGLHPGVLVARPSLPVGSVKELVEHLRASPGKLNYVSAGAGSSNQLLRMEPMVHTPESFRKYVESEIAKWTAMRGSISLEPK